MKLAIIGSREFNDFTLLESYVEKTSPSMIISGGAKGADTLAEQYAEKHAVELLIFKPDWKQFGRGAGMVRNRQIVDAAEHIMAFWDGQSKGTKASIDYARKMGKPVSIIDTSDLA